MRLIVTTTAMIAVGTLLTLCVRAAKPEPRTVRQEDVDGALRELWLSVAPTASGPSRNGSRDWQMKQTTWLPNEWPPTPQTVWTRYAYGLDVTLDGSAGVSAPFARVERRAGSDGTSVIIPMERRLKSVATHPVRPHGGWNYTLEDEKRIPTRVLALASAPSDTKQIAVYYQSWRLGSTEIAAQVAPRHRKFFDWLKEQP
jgi:hypothetical protein